MLQFGLENRIKAPEDSFSVSFPLVHSEFYSDRFLDSFVNHSSPWLDTINLPPVQPSLADREYTFCLWVFSMPLTRPSYKHDWTYSVLLLWGIYLQEELPDGTVWPFPWWSTERVQSPTPLLVPPYVWTYWLQSWSCGSNTAQQTL